MKHLPRLATVALLSGALTLSGCATGSSLDDPRLTPQQRALRQQSQDWNQTVATGALTGVAVGAIGGALVERLTGRGNGVRGALAGGALGGVAGAGLGSQVASTNARQSAAAGGYEDRIAQARQASNQLEQLTRAAESTTAQNRRTLAMLNGQYRSGQITAGQFRAQAQLMQGDLDAMQNGLRGADKVRAEMGNDPSLAQESTKQLAARARLERSAQEMQDALRVVPAA